MEAVCEAVPSLGLSGMATGVRGDRPTAETRARHVGEQPGGHGLRAAGARRERESPRPWPPGRRIETADG